MIDPSVVQYRAPNSSAHWTTTGYKLSDCLVLFANYDLRWKNNAGDWEYRRAE